MLSRHAIRNLQSSMSIVEIRNLAKKYGNKPILRDVSLSVEPGDFLVVYGMPTSGKSVLVRLLSGLEKADSGRILLRGADVTQAGAGDRNIGYVPQSFALYPHFSVRNNISYPLDLARTPKAEIEPAVRRVAELLGIGNLLDRKPEQLSGGQKQRVAIARGLVKKTDIYLLDDPLVGLDFKLRERLIDDLKATQEALKVTFVYTTSDAVEALMLAKQIAVLDGGEIIEAGEPETLYHNPQRAQTMKVVSFPQANMLAATLAIKGGVRVETGVFDAIVETSIEQMEAYAKLIKAAGSKTQCFVGIRPEHIAINDAIPAGALTSQAKVLLREDLGGEEIVYLEVQGKPITTVLRHDKEIAHAFEIDQTVTIGVQPTDMLVFVDGKQIGRGSG